MSNAPTYRQIAADFRLWREAIDPDSTMSQAEFDAMPVETGVALLVAAFGPEPKTIAQIVAAHLAGQPVAYLEDIAAHGIHNITNDFHGDTAEDYDEFADEFKRQADEALANLDAEARRDD